jgi:hypothetical protein
MTTEIVVIILVSELIVIGRLTIPGHPLTGWSGLYETAAHIWVGILIAIAYYTSMSWARWTIIWVLVFITLVEVVMFLVDQALVGD